MLLSHPFQQVALWAANNLFDVGSASSAPRRGKACALKGSLKVVGVVLRGGVTGVRER
jgi:hypothetical protein